ncbi:hypothetical protein DPMN_066555 [Dreissena polymorpha]|uniref:Uncharacterized protein n=1 Tax=Dreissena polymorpha TaxID=45954 RepID=A0A9D3YU88_DREPO|nr:hypothetical protein DPMN_066555 [Dreissena polymorpha]
MSALRVETIICALLILGSICAQHNSQAVRWHQPEQSSEDYELLANRMELTEESLRAYMFETNPVLSALRNDVRGIRKANKYLMKTLSRQRRELEDLRWATTQLKLSEVQEEERDMITQLQWTIFDLKFANERLQEDSCFRDTTCSDWTGWSHCSVTCSSGTRIRSRDCNQTGSFKSLCKPIVYDEVPCEEKACPTVEPVYEMTRCPKNYTSFDGYCLRFSGRQDTRLLSGIICNEDGGHLVTIDSNDKNEIVWEFLKKEAPQYMVDMNEDFSKREFWDFHGKLTRPFKPIYLVYKKLSAVTF